MLGAGIKQYSRYMGQGVDFRFYCKTEEVETALHTFNSVTLLTTIRLTDQVALSQGREISPRRTSYGSQRLDSLSWYLDVVCHTEKSSTLVVCWL